MFRLNCFSEILNSSFLFFLARAEAYKEDGNYEYKRKNFKEAVAAYTEGIKIKCDDTSLNAILYTNRATAQFCLGITQINQNFFYLFYVIILFICNTKNITKSK